MVHTIRYAGLAAALLLLSVAGNVTQASDLAGTTANAAAQPATSAEHCSALLRRDRGHQVHDGLEPSRIGFLSWNIKKGSLTDWQRDLQLVSAGAELVTLQEAVLDAGMADQLDGLRHQSFSPGFTTRRQVTGVATFSSTAPLSECRLTVVEPLLRTPKAINVTEYGLAGVTQTLVVVNVHAINLSLGLVRFRDQMRQIQQVLTAHDGPVILSGDFNTWRGKRMDIVNQLTSALQLRPVALRDDTRKTFNGLPLDHVFVRGLGVRQSTTQAVRSSDHNPIIVEFYL